MNNFFKYTFWAIFLLIAVRYFVGFRSGVGAVGNSANNFVATLQGSRLPQYPRRPR